MTLSIENYLTKTKFNKNELIDENIYCINAFDVNLVIPILRCFKFGHESKIFRA